MYLERLVEGSSKEWNTEMRSKEDHRKVFIHTCLDSKSSEVQYPGLVKHACQ